MPDISISPFRTARQVGTIRTSSPQVGAESNTFSVGRGNWLYKTNLYDYQARSGGNPYFEVDRIKYDAYGNVCEVKAMTFSGFGTFSSEPNIYLIGEGTDLYIVCRSAGGSASFTAGKIYAASISGTVITLGSDISVPAVAGKTVRQACFDYASRKIVVIYQDDTSHNYDAARVYDIGGTSWSTPAGANTNPYAADTKYTHSGNMTQFDMSNTGGNAFNGKGYMYLTCSGGSSGVNQYVLYNFSTASFTALTLGVTGIVFGDSTDDTFIMIGQAVVRQTTVDIWSTNAATGDHSGMGGVFDQTKNYALGQVYNYTPAAANNGYHVPACFIRVASGAGRVRSLQKWELQSMGGSPVTYKAMISPSYGCFIVQVDGGAWYEVYVGAMDNSEYLQDLGIEYTTSLRVYTTQYGALSSTTGKRTTLVIEEY